MTIDKSLYEAPDGKKNKKILLASESPADEADLELDSLMKQYEDWKKKNKGSFQDFLDDDPPIVTIKLSGGGSVEKYADLIDAYIKKIDVLEDETLTEYINRIRAAEKKKNE